MLTYSEFFCIGVSHHFISWNIDISFKCIFPLEILIFSIKCIFPSFFFDLPLWRPSSTRPHFADYRRHRTVATHQHILPAFYCILSVFYCIFFQNLTLRGFWLSEWNEIEGLSQKRLDMYSYLCSMIKSGELIVPPLNPVPLAEYKPALEATLAGLKMGKFIFKMY